MMKFVLIISVFFMSCEMFAETSCQFLLEVATTIEGTKKEKEKDIVLYDLVSYPKRIHDSGPSLKLPIIKTNKKVECQTNCFVEVFLKDKEKITGSKKFSYKYNKTSKQLEPMKEKILLFNLWENFEDGGGFLFVLYPKQQPVSCSHNVEIALRSR